MRLLSNNIAKDNIIPSAACFSQLFKEQDALIHSSNLILPATTLTNACYEHMFQKCNSLTDAPALPAMSLTESCYNGMFAACKSLTQAPALPAKTLASSCYYEMFFECVSLTRSPDLPATLLANNCYSEMFYNCKSLTNAPELKATTLAEKCYENMFTGCISLTKAPLLLATTLANSCYANMFSGCTSLTVSPALPATSLTDGCYSCMFMYCTSLTNAPELKATTLASKCYYCMFAFCESLNMSTTTDYTQAVWEFPTPTSASDWSYYMLFGTAGSTDDPVAGSMYGCVSYVPYENNNGYEETEEHEDPQAEVVIGGKNMKLEYGNDAVVLDKETYNKTKNSGENANSKNYILDFTNANVDVEEAIIPNNIVKDLIKENKGVEFRNKHGFMVIDELDDKTNNSVVVGVKEDTASYAHVKAIGTKHVEAEFNIVYKTNGREIDGDAHVYIPCDIAEPRLFYVIDDNTVGELKCEVSGGYAVFDRYLDGTYVVCK